MKVLIIEDDFTIASLLKQHFNKWGYEAEFIEDFKVVDEFVKQYNPHIILLDIVLPFFNGFYWCTQIRKFSKVPIVFLSSASDNMNIVMAMNMGGDDFIAKPFDLTVLTAKVQALLRRTYSMPEAPAIINIGNVELDMGSSTIKVNGEKTELTKNDFKILKVLMEHQGKIVSREALIESLWEDESFIDDNTLSVNIARLRKKLEDCGCAGFIKTKKGMGYIVQ